MLSGGDCCDCQDREPVRLLVDTSVAAVSGNAADKDNPGCKSSRIPRVQNMQEKGNLGSRWEFIIARHLDRDHRMEV
jgi:hypothetical protein